MVKTMGRDAKEIKALCQRLLNHEYGENAIDVGFDEFRSVHHTLTDFTGKAIQVSLIRTIEGEIIAQFSNVSPQHFLISTPKNLTLKEFDLLPCKTWYGSTSRYERFWRFLFRELRHNKLPLATVLIVSTAFLAIVNSQNLYDLIASLLIQGGTVFVSIYLIFTVTQSHQIITDSLLYERGITQRYYHDDRNVTLLALITVALTFINAMFVYIVIGIELADLPQYVEVFHRLLPAVSTSCTITLLLSCFLTISQYYLSRTIDVYERDVVSEILHKDFLKYHPDESDNQ